MVSKVTLWGKIEQSFYHFWWGDKASRTLRVKVTVSHDKAKGLDCVDVDVLASGAIGNLSSKRTQVAQEIIDRLTPSIEPLVDKAMTDMQKKGMLEKRN